MQEKRFDREASVESCDQNALHLPASEGRSDTVKYLVEEAGFDVEEPSSNDDTVFHLALRYGMLDIVKYVIESVSSEDSLAYLQMNTTRLHLTLRLKEWKLNTSMTTKGFFEVSNEQ